MIPARSGPPAGEGRIAVVAGNGLLPVVVVRALAEQGERPFVVALEGEADPVLRSYDHVELGVGEPGNLIRRLKAERVTRAVLAGGVRGRPKFSSIRLDRYTIGLVPAIIRALGKGDDVLLRALIGFIESHGIRVVGVHEIVPDLLAPAAGSMITRKRPGKRDDANIVAALRAARMIGALDIGQGAVAVGGRVIALEGVEGTDSMLERVADLRDMGRVKVAGGVLVKCVKPDQEERADLPAIGVGTVESASQAGLSGIAVEAGHSLILGYADTVERANALGLFITTFDIEAER